jgi:putative hydrolase of the HAD superfamily
MLSDKLTEREYWAEMAKSVGNLVGENWAPLDYLNAARADDINLDIRPEVTRLIHDSKDAGAKFGVLSNELELFYGKDAMDSIRILGEADAIVDATHTKILKPDPRAYAEILERLEIQPDKAVFVDDQHRNVQGAIDFGLEAVFFDVRNPKATCDLVWSTLVEL